MNLCNICPRKCNIDRSSTLGYCSSPSEVTLARASLHMWEEPCISGSNGSGTIFFSGCNMRCIFCQNHNIADGSVAKSVSTDHLSDIMLRLQDNGAHNINLVTPSHYVPAIVSSIDIAKQHGLTIPIVYNTSSYETADTLRQLEGLIDIYLPDFKYYDDSLAIKFSGARDYCNIATKAIDEMLRQQPSSIINDNGLMEYGVIVRHMILPGHTKDSNRVLSHLHDRYGDNIYISIMNQYTPVRTFEDYPELNRSVTKREYNRVIDYALDIGITNGFFQDGATDDSSFIPDFDFRGLD